MSREITTEELNVAISVFLRQMRRSYIVAYPAKECPVVEFDKLPITARGVFLVSMAAGLRTLGVTIKTRGADTPASPSVATSGLSA